MNIHVMLALMLAMCASAHIASGYAPRIMPSRAHCIDMPANLTLCQGIEYTRMRLPNLLDHESVHEVVEQSGAWTTLAQINCHPHTRLFLCSLFAPVCLDQLDYSIPPCRTLCLNVKGGCESRMNQYGFEWPAMLDCNKFPADTQMCVQPPQDTTTLSSTIAMASTKPLSRVMTCSPCAQVPTYENILDHYCQSEHVIKSRVERDSAPLVRLRRGISVKGGVRRRQRQTSDDADRRTYSGESISVGGSCQCPVGDGKYLVMANRDQHGHYIGNLVLPWTKDRQFKKAVRLFAKIDCTKLGHLIRERARRRLHASMMLEQREHGRLTTISHREPWH